MTTPRITADDALPVVRVTVAGDINTQRVVVGVADQPRVTVANTGEAITVVVSTTAAGVNSVNGAQGDVTLTTTTIAEGTNQYFTNARARTAISVTGDLAYNSSTGVVSYTSPSLATYATQTYVNTAVTNLVASAPGTLDTLNELAPALGNDANFATTITTALGTKLATSAFTATANTWQATRTTDNLTEGSTNLYFTNQRAIDAVGTNWSGPSGVINSGRWNSPYTVSSYPRGYAQWASSGNTNLNITNVSSATDTTALTVTGFSSHTNPLQKWIAGSTQVASISTGGVVTADSISLTTYPTTTNITEGTRLYYTDARARAAHSAGVGVTYDSSTGVIACSITQYTDALARGAISAGTGITYSSSTGVIASSITQYTDALAQAAITAGTGVTVTAGSVAIGQAVGTAADVTFNSVTANLANAKYILGQVYATRNTAWTPPGSGLTTIDGTNGIAVASSSGTNGYSPSVSATYYSGDTTAGVAASAAFVGRGASGTNSSPSAAASAQVLLSINADGYATSGWAQTIATSGSGSGTTGISPAQLQFYTREAFADSSGSVTAAGTGMRVRLFNTATTMSTANRISIVDHTTTTATYKAATFNIQPSASTANYAVFSTASGSINQDTLTLKNNAATTTYATFASGGSTIGGVDNPSTFTRVRGASAGTSPSLLIKNSNTVATAPATGDGTTFRLSTTGSNATTYTIADIGAQYSTAGDNSFLVQVANGDQTTGSFTGVTLINSKVTATTIAAGTASGTAGGSAVATKLTVDALKVTMAVPVAYPAYTTTQRDALTPAAGWVLWNSTTTKLQVYTGSAWADLN